MALVLLALLAVAAFPVDYRAGARLSHPHAGVQIWWEYARGTPHHHRPAAAPPLSHPGQQTTPGRVAHEPHPSHPADPAYQSNPAQPIAERATADAAPPDLPQLADIAPVVDRVAVVATAVALLLLRALVGRRLPVWPVVSTPPDRRPTPETPPPRRSPRRSPRPLSPAAIA